MGSQAIAIDLETTVKHGDHASPYLDDIHCISLNDGSRIWLEYEPETIENILTNPEIVKVFHGGSFDIPFLLHRINRDRLYDTRIVNVWDTLIMERLLTSGKNEDCGLEAVVGRYCAAQINKDIRETFKYHGGPLNAIQENYAKQDVAYLLRIMGYQKQHIDDRGMTEIAQIENELVPVVAEMEMYGIGFDPTAWDRVLKTELQIIPKVEEKIQRMLCESFQVDLFTGKLVGTINLNSPLQLVAALNRLGVKVSDTNSVTLEKQKHPVCKLILDYREHAKRAQWDYPKYVNPITNRIHPTIVQTGADTGRFSCKDPNLQNVPHDQLFRDMFVAAPGYRFIIADYAQQELRVLAEYSRDANLLEACRTADPHLENAKIIYDDPTIIKTDPRRRVAKGCSFALVYGASHETLGLSAGISTREAKHAHKALHKKYPGVDSWARKSWEFLKENGYLTTLGGRRRYFPWVYQDPGKYMTVARNTPIQGTSADMMKAAMLLIDEYIRPHSGRLVMCIHDEIIVEAPAANAVAVKEAVERGMVEAGMRYVRSVPIIAETSISGVWQK